MKKIIAFTFLTCILYSNTSFCMFKLSQKSIELRGYSTRFTRHHYMNPYIPHLPYNNLFNISSKDENATELKNLSRSKIDEFAQDLYIRNGQFKQPSDEQKKILKQQNEILVNYMTGSDNLDLSRLHNLEDQLQKIVPTE